MVADDRRLDIIAVRCDEAEARHAGEIENFVQRQYRRTGPGARFAGNRRHRFESRVG